ncbi:hypothetical protein AZI87_08940 [Bdellovibrio bacteriovorus]|uniref:Secreted protein n=1 Tax=Bdellovibrio bacteriovorus TaxID=959 RepID=A0A162GZM9_BDEBC|nr:hypothetical protein [Bdellovibrio bacteriovorus]KYG69310.1 hypothetical protein AZI87_08940 [Bdellovibrio bacteriovorus]
MKKRVLLAMAVIMVLGSVKAMAEEVDDISLMITEGKIAAAEAAAASDRCLECEMNIPGKLDAAELNMNLITIETQIKEMEKMQDEISDMENTNGLMSALGQTITTAEAVRKEIDRSADLDKSRQLVGELTKTIREFKAQLPSNQIRGLKVHHELSY